MNPYGLVEHQIAMAVASAPCQLAARHLSGESVSFSLVGGPKGLSLSKDGHCLLEGQSKQTMQAYLMGLDLAYVEVRRVSN